ncbi:MAG: MFS transporter, partial [Actinomycetota bacterium]
MTSMVAAIAPVHLLGSLAPEIQDELGFGDAAQGFAVAGFFGLSALLTSWGGAFTDRRGSTFALRVAVASSLAGAVVLMTAPAYNVIVVGLLVAAVGNAIAQPGNNAFISAGVPAQRRGFALGLKQSAIPISTGLAGLALPVIAISAGWRFAYLYPIAIAAAALLLIPPVPTAPAAPATARVFRPSRGLVLVTAGAVAAGVGRAPGAGGGRGGGGRGGGGPRPPRPRGGGGGGGPRPPPRGGG